MLDKTPAWINYTALQAINIDGDMMKKINMLLSGIFGSGTDNKVPAKQPQGRVEEMTDLRKMGFNVRRV